jgi:hypothetical protein
MIFVAITALLVVASIELILGVARRVSGRIEALLYPDDGMWISDPLVGRRPNPDYPGHDEWGFRNPLVPETARIVALGDSLTYGTMLDSEQSWPRQLEQISGISTYNMAFGGFGPAHELLLWDEARQLDPEVVIVAMYAGNDLFDCFSLTYGGENLKNLRSTEPATLDALNALRGEDTLGDLRDHGEPRAPLIAWVRKNSSTYGLLRSLRDVVFGRHWRDDPEWVQAKTQANYPGNAAFESADAKTVFTIARRTVAVDFDDVRIREGHRISLAALRRLHQQTAESGAQMAVLLLPTKEYVFSERVLAEGGEPIEGYSALIENERAMWEKTRRFLAEHGIPQIDALTSLRASFSDGKQPFRRDSDGHLNAHGSRQVAEFVYAELRERGFIEP